MTKHLVAFALLASGASNAASAQTTPPADVGRYCGIVEKQIVSLAHTATSANEDLAAFSHDQRAADPVKFAKAKALLASVTDSLKEKETEWFHLGCVHIIYGRRAGN